MAVFGLAGKGQPSAQGRSCLPGGPVWSSLAAVQSARKGRAFSVLQSVSGLHRRGQISGDLNATRRARGSIPITLTAALRQRLVTARARGPPAGRSPPTSAGKRGRVPARGSRALLAGVTGSPPHKGKNMLPSSEHASEEWQLVEPSPGEGLAFLALVVSRDMLWGLSHISQIRCVQGGRKLRPAEYFWSKR